MSASLSGFAGYLQTALLNHLFGTPAYAQPIGMAIGLFSTLPDASGSGGVELSGGGYVRRAFRNFNAPSGSPPTVVNAVQIQWPAATADWPAIVGAGIFEDMSGTNLLAFGNLVSAVDGVTPVSVIIRTGDVLRIGVGNLVVGFTAAAPGGLAVLHAMAA